MRVEYREVKTKRASALVSLLSLVTVLSLPNAGAQEPAPSCVTPHPPGDPQWTASETLAPGQSVVLPLPGSAGSGVSSTLRYDKGTAPERSVTSGTGLVGTSTRKIVQAATGRITADITWQDHYPSFTFTGSIGAGETKSYDLVSSANGNLWGRVNWPSSVAGARLGLTLLEDGIPVVLGADPYVGASSHLVQYPVTDLGTYPSKKVYTLRVDSLGLATTFELNGAYPVSPNMSATLTRADGQLVAGSELVGGRRHRRIDVASADAGEYFIRLNSDVSSNYSLAESHQVMEHAPVTFEILDPTGSPLVSGRSTSGTQTLNASSAEGELSLRVANDSESIAIPSFTVDSWGVTAPGEAGQDVGENFQSYVTSVRTVPITTGSFGNVSISVGWAPSLRRGMYSGTSLFENAWERTVAVTAEGEMEANLSWGHLSSVSPVPPNLDLYLIDSLTGEVLDKSEELLGLSESISYFVEDLGPTASRELILRVVSRSGNASFYMSVAYPVLNDLDLALYNNEGRKVGYGQTKNNPEALRATDLPAGNYFLRVTSQSWGSTTGFTGSVTKCG